MRSGSDPPRSKNINDATHHIMIPLTVTIEEPEQGAWVADLTHTDPYSGTFELGGYQWLGAALSSVLDGGRYQTRVVGGKGKLGSLVRDQYYYGGGTGDTVIQDIARSVGESYVSGVPARVASWSRQSGTAGQALDQICQTLGILWWVDLQGRIRAGARAEDPVDLSKYTQTTADVDGEISLVGDSASGIVPGMTIDGKIIRHVRWTLTGTRLTAECSFVPYVLPDVRGGLDYLCSHRAVVESQESDGTVNLIVGNRFSLTKVPYQGGIPGTIKLLPGDVVTACSWGRDPRQWFAHSVQRVEGRVTIDCGTLLFMNTPAAPPGTGGLVTFIKQFLPGEEAALEIAKKLIVPPNIAIEVPILGMVKS